MRDFIIVLIVFGSIPFILMRSHIGILMWYWVSLMNPHRLTWGYAYQMHVAVIVGGATLIAWVASRERKLPPMTAPNVWLLLFTFWVSISTYFALSPTATIYWDEVIKILFMTFVATCIVNSRPRIRQLVWVVALSIAFYGIKGGVWAIMTGGHYRVWGPPGSFIEDNNQLGVAMIMVMPLLYYLSLDVTRKWLRLGLYSGMGFTLIATLCTYSRGALVGLSVTLLVFGIKAKRRLLTGTVAAAVFAGALAFLPATWYQRMDTIDRYQQDASAEQRLTVWQFAIRLADDHPLVGGGFNVIDNKDVYYHYVSATQTVHNFHSIYFQVLGENGYVGLGLFLGLILTTLATAQGIIRKTRNLPAMVWAGQLASAIQVSIVGYCSAGSFVNLGFYDLFYVLVAIVTATKIVVERSLAAETARAGEAIQEAPALAPVTIFRPAGAGSNFG